MWMSLDSRLCDSARFSIETSHICTASGATVSSLPCPDGSFCISDGVRCIFDGSVLYAALDGEVCGPASVHAPWWRRPRRHRTFQ